MAMICQSTRRTRGGQPDPCGEARQLRRIIRDLESKIEGACEDLRHIEGQAPGSLGDSLQGVRADLQRALNDQHANPQGDTHD